MSIYAPQNSYQFNEGTLHSLSVFTDRTANIFYLGEPETAKLNVTIARDQLKDGEALAAYITRQIAILADKLKGHKLQKRYAATLGDGADLINGEAIDATHILQNKTYHQRQSAFALAGDKQNRVLIFSLTQDKPFDAGINEKWQTLLKSFKPRS